MDAIHLRRRASFNDAPAQYARARPGYPDAVFDLILTYAGLGPGATALEIGCGPGQATIPMLARGIRITAVELGDAMADLVRARATGSDLVVHVGAFEEWDLTGATFDLVFSGSAFHWIDPTIRYMKTAALLREDGTLAVFWNRQVRGPEPEPFGDSVQDIYDREAPALSRDFEGLPIAEELDCKYLAEMEDSGLYADLQVRNILWERSFTTEQYVELIDTYSDHHTLPEETKARLYAAVAHLIDERFGGSVTRNYATQVFLGRRV